MVHNLIILKSERNILFLHPDEIDWLEAEGNNIRLHFRNESRLIRAQMNHLEEMLSPEYFLRINRSAIVNFDFIREMEPGFRGVYRTVLRDGTELILSRNYRERLFSQIALPLRFRSISMAK